jgi:hypothetical protein
MNQTRNLQVSSPPAFSPSGSDVRPSRSEERSGFPPSPFKHRAGHPCLRRLCPALKERRSASRSPSANNLGADRSPTEPPFEHLPQIPEETHLQYPAFGTSSRLASALGFEHLPQTSEETRFQRPALHTSAGGFPCFVSNTFHKPPKRLASSIRPSHFQPVAFRAFVSNTFHKPPKRLASSIRPSALSAGGFPRLRVEHLPQTSEETRFQYPALSTFSRWLSVFRVEHLPQTSEETRFQYPALTLSAGGFPCFVSNTFHKPPKRLASSIRPSHFQPVAFRAFVSNTFHKPPKRLAFSIRPSALSAGGPGHPLPIPPTSGSRKNPPSSVSNASSPDLPLRHTTPNMSSEELAHKDAASSQHGQPRELCLRRGHSPGLRRSTSSSGNSYPLPSNIRRCSCCLPNLGPEGLRPD